jgi:hypothetical protein
VSLSSALDGLGLARGGRRGVYLACMHEGEIADACMCSLLAFFRSCRTNMKLSTAGVVQTGGSAAVKVDDKYAFMAKATPAGDAGAADAAWDD